MPALLSAGELISAPAPSDCQLSRYHRVAKKLATACGPVMRQAPAKPTNSPPPLISLPQAHQLGQSQDDNLRELNTKFCEPSSTKTPTKARRVVKTLDSKRLPRIPRNPSRQHPITPRKLVRQHTSTPRKLLRHQQSPGGRRMRLAGVEERFHRNSPVNSIHKKWRQQGAFVKSASQDSAPYSDATESGFPSTLNADELGSATRSGAEVGRGEKLSNATQLSKSGPSSSSAASSSTLSTSDLDLRLVMREKLRKTYVLRDKRK